MRWQSVWGRRGTSSYPFPLSCFRLLSALSHPHLLATSPDWLFPLLSLSNCRAGSHCWRFGMQITNTSTHSHTHPHPHSFMCSLTYTVTHTHMLIHAPSISNLLGVKRESAPRVRIPIILKGSISWCCWIGKKRMSYLLPAVT